MFKDKTHLSSPLSSRRISISTRTIVVSSLLVGALVIDLNNKAIAQTNFQETVNQCIYLINSGQQLSPETQTYCYRVLQQQRCILRVQQIFGQALYELNTARARLGSCSGSDEVCRSYWQPRVWDAEQNFNQVSNSMVGACP